MIALSLFCASCTTSSRPAFQRTTLGNAVIAPLPAGTEILAIKKLPGVEAAFANEIEGTWWGASEWRCLKLKEPLVLATPAYIAERDRREIELMKEIERLRIGK